jgi:hypothetical protein
MIAGLLSSIFASRLTPNAGIRRRGVQRLSDACVGRRTAWPKHDGVSELNSPAIMIGWLCDKFYPALVWYGKMKI